MKRITCNLYHMFSILRVVSNAQEVAPSCVIQSQISLYNKLITMNELINKRITECGDNIKKKQVRATSFFCLTKKQELTKVISTISA